MFENIFNGPKEIFHNVFPDAVIYCQRFQELIIGPFILPLVR